MLTTHTVFISYNHQDTDWMNRLRTQLHALSRETPIEIWIDRDALSVGRKLTPVIKAAIDRACIAVLLISADYLTSDYILEHELSYILERSNGEKGRNGVLELYPIQIEPLDLTRISRLSDRLVRRDKVKPSLIEDTEANAKSALAAYASETIGMCEQLATAETISEIPNGENLAKEKIPKSSRPKTDTEALMKVKVETKPLVQPQHPPFMDEKATARPKCPVVTFFGTKGGTGKQRSQSAFASSCSPRR